MFLQSKVWRPSICPYLVIWNSPGCFQALTFSGGSCQFQDLWLFSDLGNCLLLFLWICLPFCVLCSLLQECHQFPRHDHPALLAFPFYLPSLSFADLHSKKFSQIYPLAFILDFLRLSKHIILIYYGSWHYGYCGLMHYGSLSAHLSWQGVFVLRMQGHHTSPGILIGFCFSQCHLFYLFILLLLSCVMVFP